MRRGIHLIEIVVVVSVLSILVSLAVMAVQQARESVRSTYCKNNLRQLAIANQLHETSIRYFPNSDLAAGTLNRLPSGALAQLSYFLDDRSYLISESIYSERNRILFSSAKGVLTCPGEPSSNQIFGELVETLGSHRRFAGSVGVASYATNAGVPFFAASVPNRGPIPTSLTRVIRCRAAEVSDGLSNTLALWESCRSQMMVRKNGQLTKTDWEAFVGGLVDFRVTTFDAHGNGWRVSRADYFSFLLGWGGSSAGSIVPFDSDGNLNVSESGLRRTININNQSRGPFSFHGGFANAACLDGSVFALDEQIDFNVVFRLAGMADGELLHP